MMSGTSPTPPAGTRRSVPGANAPQIEGERLVAWYRLGVAALMLLFIATYWTSADPRLRPPLLLSAGLTGAWALLSGAILSVHRRGLLRPWMSYLTIGLDLALVTAMQWAVVLVMPLHFTNGPISGLYFVMIGLAALRGSRRLVITAGASAAAIHVAFSAAFFQRLFPEMHVLAMPDGYAIGINFLDEVGKALAMAMLGIVIGFVTASLRTSERRYLHLFDHLPDGALIVDEQGRIRTANQRLADMVGARRESLAGRFVGTLLPRSPVDSKGVSTLLRSDGAEVPVRTSSEPIRYRGDPCLEISVRDVSEQVQLEHQLTRSARMENVGQLAGGLAHDFNNLLGGIIGAASLAARSLARTGDTALRRRLAERVDFIRQRGEAARDVVGRLLTFSRRSPRACAPVDLARIVREGVEICRNTFSENTDIVVDLPDGEAAVEGDAGALSQALLNLCINAQDAMPEGGTLEIRLGEASSPDPGGSEAGGERGAGEECWRIEVSDTGCGMDNATRERIFDPFFSTKPHATGTGLGLSMVESIARDHGGFVEVESAPGRGSTFRLVLARSRVSLLPVLPGEESPRGSGRILFVDDDDIVRSTVSGMLTELGYEVACAAGGEEAIRLFESRGESFDLLLLDLMMPGLDGLQTLERLRARGAAAPAVIATGFWSGDRDAEAEKLAVTGVLRKPFSISALARELARILAGEGGPR